MAEAISDGPEDSDGRGHLAWRRGSAVGFNNASCDRRYVSVCRSRLPAASPSPFAAVRTEIAPPGIEPGDFLASQRKPRARPFGQAGLAGSGFCDRTTLFPKPSGCRRIVVEAFSNVGGVSISHIVRHYAHSPTFLFRAEPHL